MTTTTTAVSVLLERITENLKPIDTDAAYDEMLDDCYSLESVGGPFQYMSASRVLKEMDEIAYRCGKNDYVDSMEWIEIGDDYFANDDVEAERDDYVSELESELDDLERELEELDEEEEGESYTGMCKDVSVLIDAKKAQIAEVEKYTF